MKVSDESLEMFRSIWLKDSELVKSWLSEREIEVLLLRCGLGGNEPYSLAHIGRKMNVTRERIRQIEAKAIRKMRHPVRSKKLRSFIDS